MSDNFRIGGYGADGCTCAITAAQFCPIHGEDEYLSYDGKRRKADREAIDARWACWVAEAIPCEKCGATVEGVKQREKHRYFHQKFLGHE